MQWSLPHPLQKRRNKITCYYITIDGGLEEIRRGQMGSEKRGNKPILTVEVDLYPPCGLEQDRHRASGTINVELPVSTCTLKGEGLVPRTIST